MMNSSDDTEPVEPGDAAADSAWDAVGVMREWAAETLLKREEAIAALRESMGDAQTLDQFGIDLGEIER